MSPGSGVAAVNEMGLHFTRELDSKQELWCVKTVVAIEGQAGEV